MGQKLTEKKKVQDKFFHVTIAYLKEKIRFYRKFFPRNKKNLFFGSKMGGRLITGSTYTRVNTVYSTLENEVMMTSKVAYYHSLSLSIILMLFKNSIYNIYNT